MFLSTLATLPGVAFHVRGAVLAGASTHALRPDKLNDQLAQVMNTIVAQAGQMGADAVIDVKVTRINDSSYVITGTAVATIPAR